MNYGPARDPMTILGEPELGAKVLPVVLAISVEVMLVLVVAVLAQWATTHHPAEWVLAVLA